MRLAERIRTLCDADGVALVQLMLDAGVDGTATVVLAVDGLPVPDAHSWGALTVENPLLWWWDSELALDPAPALGDQSPGRWPSSTAR